MNKINKQTKDRYVKEKICSALEGEDIEIINVEGKPYKIKLRKLTAPTLLSAKSEWITAYVELDKDVERVAAELLDNQTYHEGKVYGVDTAHSYNIGMHIKEKRKDALLQIRKLIKSYLKLKKEK
jgi:hypothetical protein